jgi:CRISPR-associated exonuclease Cas4
MVRDDTYVTGTLVWYYAICPRECWLMAHQIEPEREFDLLAEGRFITEAHYEREKKEIELPGGVKVDKVRREGGKLVLSEIKKSSKFLPAAKLQLAFYLWTLEQEGVQAVGEVLIPKERKKFSVVLDDEARAKLAQATEEITALLRQSKPPAAKWLKFCPNCAYAEFCWSGGTLEPDS